MNSKCCATGLKLLYVYDNQRVNEYFDFGF